MAIPLRDLSFSLFLILPGALLAQAPKAQETPAAERGSIIEDRAARKLLQAGDARLELGENEKALDVWESVVERYPGSQVRFEAHLRLADHLLKEVRDPDKARLYYVDGVGSRGFTSIFLFEKSRGGRRVSGVDEISVEESVEEVNPIDLTPSMTPSRCNSLADFALLECP